eukprot:Selendium_serpulae@DN3799_c0_g1_i1.p1
MTSLGMIGGICLGSALPVLENGKAYPYPLYGEAGYRIVLLLPAVVATWTLSTFITQFPEESPPFLVSNNRISEAAAVLRKIHDCDELEPHGELAHLLATEQRTNQAAEHVVDPGITPHHNPAVTSRLVRRAVFIGVSLALLQPLTGVNAYVAKSVPLLTSVGVRIPRLASVIMAFLNFASSFLSFYLMDIYGRRTLMIMGALGQFFSLAPLVAVSHVYTQYAHLLPVLAVLAVCGSVVSFAIGGPVLWIYLNEMYPQSFKSTMLLLSAAINWFSTVFVVSLPSVLSVTPLFTFFLLSSFTSLLILSFFVVETRGLTRSPYAAVDAVLK